MTDYENDELQEEEDQEALREAEKLILDVAERSDARTLSELRQAISESDPSIDSTLLRAALWSLLNRGRLRLNADRTLTVGG